MADVFISYSRTDRDRCTAIRTALSELKVDVWSDVGIAPGSAFDREIEKQIGTAEALLVLWSPHSTQSDWVRNEARTGKVRDRLIAVQIVPCELPLEFHSIQSDLLPIGTEGTAQPTWLNLLSRLGDILDRPGLAEYTRLRSEGDLDGWKHWLRRYASDPLAADVIDRIVDYAMPDMRKQLAGERSKRTTLEAAIAEHTDSASAQSAEIATSARELVRVRTELEEARTSRRQAEAELERFRIASGGKVDVSAGEVGIGIMLMDRQAKYVALLLWAFAITFGWENLSRLFDGRGGLGDVFWLAFTVIALCMPAALLTGKLVRKRLVMPQLESQKESED